MQNQVFIKGTSLTRKRESKANFIFRISQSSLIIALWTCILKIQSISCLLLGLTFLSLTWVLTGVEGASTLWSKELPMITLIAYRVLQKVSTFSADSWWHMDSVPGIFKIMDRLAIFSPWMEIWHLLMCAILESSLMDTRKLWKVSN